MNPLDAAIERARQHAARDPKPQPSEAELKRLAATLDRTQPREWYRVTHSNGAAIDVFFHPPVTLQEARDRYPGCDVKPA